MQGRVFGETESPVNTASANVVVDVERGASTKENRSLGSLGSLELLFLAMEFVTGYPAGLSTPEKGLPSMPLYLDCCSAVSAGSIAPSKSFR